ncbi:MAG: acetyl-CoA C-acyltransferase, partial [Verrucomicrobiota bacterium]
KFTALARAKTAGQRLAAMARFRPADFSPVIGLKLGLTDPVVSLSMGETAELLAREFELSREEQDEFALKSHQKAALAGDRLQQEIAPVFQAHASVQVDNGVREKQSMESLAKLRPVFERSHGTVTAGNSSQITDGAVALLVMAEQRAEKLGLEPLGRLVDYHYSGCDPARMGLGPAFAIGELKKKTGLAPMDADVVEINEAFAAQVLATLQCLEDEGFAKAMDLEGPIGAVQRHALNPNGGAIALGHPVGASGARLVLTALHELRRTEGKRALVSLCVGGGQGGALWLERV